MLIGVISDTHGLLRPEAVSALTGCALIVHAGDVGSPEVLRDLERIAPVHAVRGNVDTEPWARRLPECRTVEVLGLRLHVLHDAKDLKAEPDAQPWNAVISGHTHKAASEVRGGMLYLNPGSAGPRRFGLPVTVAVIDARSGGLWPRILELAV